MVACKQVSWIRDVKRFRIGVICGIWLAVLFVGDSTGHAQSRLSPPLFYEAESVLAKYTEVEMDFEAYGRIYVRAARNDRYAPLAELRLPQRFGEVTVWARIRGCSQVLKTNVAGKGVDLKWQHRVPDRWTWVCFGTFAQDQLGATIRIVRAPGPDGGLDAIFLDPTGEIRPETVENIKLYEID